MRYINRRLERKFLHMNGFFKAVLVTGARQVGKTTMLRHLAEDTNRTYVTMDNIVTRSLAKADPVLFFQTYKPPILIDEIQYAPELLSQIKLICDNTEETGLFWLTGSQKFNVMRNISDSLAGRICILELYSLALNEKIGVNFENNLDFSFDNLQERRAAVPKNDIVSVYRHIWEGGMPQTLNADAEQRREYYNAYINTYVMRDVAEFTGITDSFRFSKFITACAALISEQVNFKTLAETADISQPTAKDWLNILAGLGIVFLLQPYVNNMLKRLAKTPKLYFTDSGLAAHMSMWLTPETLMNGAASGHYFENFVVAELLKHYAYAPDNARLSYYRDANDKEIDIFVEENNVIHPFEIKKSAVPDRREVKKFSVLDSASISRGSGGIICMCEDVTPIDAGNCFIPCNLF